MDIARRRLDAVLFLSLAACGSNVPAVTTPGGHDAAADSPPGRGDAAADAGRDAPAEGSGGHGLTVETYTSSATGQIDIQVNSHLIAGKTEAILVDGQLLAADAQAVVSKVKGAGKKLTHVFLTHAHPDHYAGFAVVESAFPGVRFVTTPGVLEDFQAAAPGTFAYLQKALGSLVADHLVTPAALSGSLTVDGFSLQVIEMPDPGESTHAAAVALPGNALVSGDLLYDDVHLFLGNCTYAGWRKNLTAIQAMGFLTFYPGHGKSPVGDDVFASVDGYIGAAVPILRAAEAMDGGTGDGGDPRVGLAVGEIAKAMPDFRSDYLLGFSTTTFIDTSKCP